MLALIVVCGIVYLTCQEYRQDKLAGRKTEDDIAFGIVFSLFAAIIIPFIGVNFQTKVYTHEIHPIASLRTQDLQVFRVGFTAPNGSYVVNYITAPDTYLMMRVPTQGTYLKEEASVPRYECDVITETPSTLHKVLFFPHILFYDPSPRAFNHMIYVPKGTVVQTFESK